jgi:hypothetical protein
MVIVTEDAGVQAFYNGTQRFQVTNTGIDVTGTVTADGLTVNSGAENLVATFQSTDTEAQIALVDTTGTSTIRARNDFRFHVNNAATPALKIDSNNDISFYEDTGTTAKLFWDASAESLGIGTSSPDSALVVQGGQGTYAQIKDGTVTTLLQARGQDSIGVVGTLSNHGFGFFTNSTERMRIDSSGNLLVGKTTSSYTTDGFEALAAGAIQVSDTNTNPVGVNRNGTDGSLISFFKSGTSVGSIGTLSSKIYVGSDDTSLFFDSLRDALVPHNASTNAARGSAIDLGRDVVKFKDLYLSGSAFVDTQLRAGAGSASQPSVSFYADSDSGMFRATTNALGFSTAGTEAMRIDSSGNLLVGTTSALAGNDHCFVSSSSDTTVAIQKNSGAAASLPLAVWQTATTGNNLFVKFFTESSATERGNIDYNRTGNQVRYNVTSDQRLKENIVAASSASDDIDAIQVRQFDWVENGYHQSYGLIAQELLTVVPDAVSQPEDPEKMMGVDYSKLVPMMLKEIQSLRARVAQLEGEA